GFLVEALYVQCRGPYADFSRRRERDESGGGDGGDVDAEALQIRQLALDGLLPGGQVGFEVGSIALLESVLELVESSIFGVEQGPVLRQEVVVDHLGQRHGQLP